MPFRVIAPDEEIEERLEELRVFQIHGKCPEPGCDGELRGTGQGFTTNVTRWRNKCTRCDVELSLPESYPYIGYRLAQQDDRPLKEAGD